MKKIILYFASLLIGLSLFISCDDTNEPIILNDSDKFIAFENSTFAANENGDKVGILAYIVSNSTTGAAVNFDFDTVGITNPAIQDVDFTVLNSTQTLSFSNGFGYDTIWIQPIDNDSYEKDKTVNILLSNPTNQYNLGAKSSLTLTVVDNEHPLSLVIGDYQIDFESGFSGGGAGIVNISTKPNPDDETQITFQINEMFPGWGFTDDELIYANIDLTEMTIKIAAGQPGANHGYGPSIFTGYDGVTDEQFAIGEFISGTIDPDGTIHIPHYTGLQITEGGNVGLWFDLWAYSDWTKTGKKSTLVSNTINKQPREFR